MFDCLCRSLLLWEDIREVEILLWAEVLLEAAVGDLPFGIGVDGNSFGPLRSEALKIDEQPLMGVAGAIGDLALFSCSCASCSVCRYLCSCFESNSAYLFSCCLYRTPRWLNIFLPNFSNCDDGVWLLLKFIFLILSSRYTRMSPSVSLAFGDARAGLSCCEAVWFLLTPCDFPAIPLPSKLCLLPDLPC